MPCDRIRAGTNDSKCNCVSQDTYARRKISSLDTFRVLGVEFVSLGESLDTATPPGRMAFTVLGAVAELERSLIVERVKAGLRNARAKGKRLGRPSRNIDGTTVAALRSQGASWRTIAQSLGVWVSELFIAQFQAVPKLGKGILERTKGDLPSLLRSRMPGTT